MLRSPMSTRSSALFPYSPLFRSVVHRLLTALRTAACGDVVGRLGVEVGAVGGRVEHRVAEVDGMDAGELAAALAAGGADGIDDIGCGHGRIPFTFFPLPLRERDVETRQLAA